MRQIITQRHPFTFYFSILVGFFVFLAIGIACLFAFVNDDQTETTRYLLLVVPFLMVALGIYTPFRYFKNVPIIKIDDQFIKIGREIYPLNGIETVSLTGKVNFPYIVNFPTEGIKVQMKDGTKRLIYDDMYTNLWQVKLLLNELVLGNKVRYPVDLNVDERTITTDAITTFKGSALFSLRGYTLWSILAIMFYGLVKEITSDTPLPIFFPIIMGVFIAFWFTFCSWLLYYFQITNTHLVIRNHYWFSEKKIYALKDIAEITFETEAKQPNSMRIILKDFRTARYRAGSLRDKTWLSLQKALEDRNIKVRNECIHDPATSL